MLLIALKTPSLTNVLVNLKSILVEAKFDTGSDVNALSSTTYYNEISNVTLIQAPLNLKSAANNECAILGEMDLVVELADVLYKQ